MFEFTVCAISNETDEKYEKKCNVVGFEHANKYSTDRNADHYAICAVYTL